MTDPLPGKPSLKKMPRKQLLWYGGAGLAGLAAVWWVMRKRGAQNQDPGLDPNGYSAATGDVSGYQQAGYYDPGTGAFIGGIGANGNVGTIFNPSTNASWAQQVEAYMTNLGYDPLAVGAALGKYLTGQTLSDDQKSMVQAALAFFGAPPGGVPPVSTTPPAPPPAPTPTPTPVPHSTPPPVPPHGEPAPTQTYTVMSGDTLWGIAQHFYGRGTSWTKIYERNAALIDQLAAQHGKAGGGHWIFPGTVLVIPS